MLEKNAFKTDLLNSPLCSDTFDCSLEDAVELYNKELKAILDKHCPVRRRVIKKKLFSLD